MQRKVNNEKKKKNSENLFKKIVFAFCAILFRHFCLIFVFIRQGPNRLSSTIGGNREMDQLYTTSQVSNMTRRTKFFLYQLTCSPRLNKKV